ncbi:hypothetical protein GUITHDRAFT_133066 [Guillardia theta CCMP2712]|uniref:Uncharacterized protein n=1 Tax=Guillardia theta (strain CCMP2712) TaxID=905079 RepID=L1JYD8_GUITC|nr:hypothetical protein GUITHDRAFT_133066 [Guillardia theta CCMP2712]EKX53334.1 hypothetical protein GUITHDRAFT_133066 [Guillardia theta CCMP2712]|eukprot:XP_005840314.1 hypothetical protein GUITHDRAFT_133066 [Guillardia theta CCMP2712]
MSEEAPSPEAQEDLVSLRIQLLDVKLSAPAVDEQVALTYRLQDDQGDELKDAEKEGKLQGSGELSLQEKTPGKPLYENVHVFPQQDSEAHRELLADLLSLDMLYVVTATVGSDDYKGGCSVSLVPLIWRKRPQFDDEGWELEKPTVEGWFTLLPLTSPEAAQSAEPPVTCEVHVRMELSRPVFSIEEEHKTNVITVNVRGLYNLPPTWNVGEGEEMEDHKYWYEAAYDFPSSSGSVQVTAENGSLSVPSSQDESDVRSESEKAFLQGTLQEISLKEEDQSIRVVWNHRFRTFMTPSTLDSFKDAIQKARFPVSIRRVLKSGADYVYTNKYKGLANVDLSGIMANDIRTLAIRCPVGPAADFSVPTEEELQQLPPPEGVEETEEILHNGEATNPYLRSETYLLLEIVCARPIVPKPQSPPPPLATVREILEQRAPVDSLESLPSTTLEQLNKDFRWAASEILGEIEATGKQRMSIENALQTVMTQLNSKGKYHDLKERIQHSVLQVVKERFHRGSVGDISNEIANLNAFLREQLKRFIMEFFDLEAEKPKFTGDVSGEDLLTQELELAVEAELLLRYDKAKSHLQNRLVSDSNNSSLWYDLGTMTIRSGDYNAAKEYLNKAVEVDGKNMFAFLALGSLFFLQNEMSKAEESFRQACECGANALAWACSACFYDIEAREQERRTCDKQLNSIEKKMTQSKVSPYLRAGSFFAEMNATLLVEQAMAQEVQKNRSSDSLHLILGRTYLNNGEYDKSREHLDAVISSSPGSADAAVALTLKGHTWFMELEWHKYRSDFDVPPAKDVLFSYNKSLSSRNPNIDLLQYIRMARLHIAMKEFAEAQKVMEKACKLRQYATCWLGLAVACFHKTMPDLSLVENCLQQASILDSRNAEVWGMITLNCMHQAGEITAESPEFEIKMSEALFAFRQALMYGLSLDESFPTEISILEQIAVNLEKYQKYGPASEALRRAFYSVKGIPTSTRLLRLFVAVDVISNDHKKEEMKETLDRAIMCLDAPGIDREGLRKSMQKYAHELQKKSLKERRSHHE